MENDQNNQNNPNTQDPPNPISTAVENSDATEQVTNALAQAPTEQEQLPTENSQNPNQNQYQNSPNPSGSIVTSPSKGSNKLLLIGLVLLIIAVTVTAIYFFFQNKKDSTKNEKKIIPTISQQLSSPTPTPDPTENWEVHKSSEYQVKYPNDLIAGGDKDMLNIAKWGPTQTEGTELFDGYAVTFIQKENQDSTPEEYTQTLIEEAESVGVSEITEEMQDIEVNGYNGVTYTEEGLGTYKQIILGSNDNSSLVHISVMVADPGNLGFQEEVDQILSTFEFVTGE